MGCGACLRGFGTVEAARGSGMMSASPRRTALPAPSLRVGGEILAFTKSQVDPLESELIQRVLSGQHEAFRELVRPCEHAVFMATQAILKNEADAEDAAQEAILKAFTNLATFRGDSKFSTWLVRIATNEALMKMRKEPPHKLHDRRNRPAARHRKKRGENTPPACPPSDARRSCTGYGCELEHRPEGIQT